MKGGIFQGFDLGSVATGGSIEDASGRKSPRCGDDACLGHLTCGHDCFGFIGRIVDGGDAKGQSGIIHPILLRDDSLVSLLTVGMGIDQAWHEEPSFEIHAVCPIGYGNRFIGSDCGDAVALYQDGMPIFNLWCGHGEDACAGQRQHSRWLVVVDLHAEWLDVGFELGRLTQVSEGIQGEWK